MNGFWDISLFLHDCISSLSLLSLAHSLVLPLVHALNQPLVPPLPRRLVRSFLHPFEELSLTASEGFCAWFLNTSQSHERPPSVL